MADQEEKQPYTDPLDRLFQNPYGVDPKEAQRLNQERNDLLRDYAELYRTPTGRRVLDDILAITRVNECPDLHCTDQDLRAQTAARVVGFTIQENLIEGEQLLDHPSER